MTLQLLQALQLSLIAAALLGAVMFVVSYPARVHPRYWVREGWHMWLFTLGLVLLGASSIVRRIWPGLGGTLVYESVVTATFAMLAIMVWDRDFLLFTAPRRDRDQRKKDRP